MLNQLYQKCISACVECATICNHCAISCLEEKEVQNLTKCIRLDLECAVVCRATAELMTLNSAFSPNISGLCATICDACAEECENHTVMEHCKECAEACRTCAKEAFIIFQDLKNIKPEKIAPIAYHDECAILSRAAAELISLGTSWSLQISELNDIVCKASAAEFERHLDFQMKQSKEYTSVATDIHQKLLDQEKERKEVIANELKTTDQIVLQREEGKRRRRHVSALLAASLGRSAMNHVRSHITTDISGKSGLANTGTVITYEE